MKKLFYICLLSAACFTLQAQEAKNNIDFTQDDSKKEFQNYYSEFMSYRLEIGYAQDWQNSNNNTVRDMYAHGANLGVTFDFNLKYNISMQTGLLYSFTYGRTDQHWSTLASKEDFLRHDVTHHSLIIPVRCTYTQPLWKRLALYFYTGPELAVGLAQKDNIKLDNISDATLAWLQANNINTTSYDRYTSDELRRFNVRWGLGGGLQWDVYRLQAGYSFGLNNLYKQQTTIPDAYLSEWGWNVSFSWMFK